MFSVFRNPEIKGAALKLLLIQLVLTIGVLAFTAEQIGRINNNIVNSNQALIGHVLTKHPEMEGELIGFVTKDISDKELTQGIKVLKQYGYEKNMDILSSPSIRDSYKGFMVKVGALLLLCFLPIVLLVIYEYSKVFSKVRLASKAAEKVVGGDFSLVLEDDREGDISLLGHNFNMMALRLKKSLEALKLDKIFLKNIISDISHQLKTPLSSLVMFNELMLEDITMKEHLREDFLERSKSQLNRMEWLILNLLKMARLEAGAIEFKKEQILLVNAIHKAVNALRDKLDIKKQLLEVAGDFDKVYFTGDEEWTAEAVINILKNCIEHTPEGGHISIELSETPLFSSIIIRDNGEGIDKKDLPRIFERFYKGTDSVKTESVGIGLALSKLIIEGQGGSISVWSEKGKGTKFEITFLKSVI
jgi:signal transduction histidine kinase